MFRINLLDTSFSVESDKTPEYVEKLVAHYQQQIQRIQRTTQPQDTLKTAILAALLVTDELFQERSTRQQASEIHKITTRLISDIDEFLLE